MTSHLGRIQACEFEKREVRIALGSAACRVCGGRSCRLKDRVVRAALREDTDLLPDDLRVGDVVRIATDRCAMVRAVLRLVVIPLGVGLAVGTVVEPAVAVGAGLAATLLAVGVSVAFGSRRRDLPFVVERVLR